MKTKRSLSFGCLICAARSYFQNPKLLSGAVRQRLACGYVVGTHSGCRLSLMCRGVNRRLFKTGARFLSAQPPDE